MKRFTKIGLMAFIALSALAAAFLVSCESPVAASKEASAAGVSVNGVLIVVSDGSAASAARTIMPSGATPERVIEKYVLVFTPVVPVENRTEETFTLTSKNALTAIEDTDGKLGKAVFITTGGIEKDISGETGVAFDLDAGGWTVTVTATGTLKNADGTDMVYTATNEDNPEPFTVPEHTKLKATQVEVPLKTVGVQGTFSWDLTLPAGMELFAFSLKDKSGALVPGTPDTTKPIRELNPKSTAPIPLDAGSYDLIITLKKAILGVSTGLTTSFYETVKIFPGQDTKAWFDFTKAPADPNNNKDPVCYNVSFATYIPVMGEMLVTNAGKASPKATYADFTVKAYRDNGHTLWLVSEVSVPPAGTYTGTAETDTRSWVIHVPVSALESEVYIQVESAKWIMDPDKGKLPGFTLTPQGEVKQNILDAAIQVSDAPQFDGKGQQVNDKFVIYTLNPKPSGGSVWKVYKADDQEKPVATSGVYNSQGLNVDYNQQTGELSLTNTNGDISSEIYYVTVTEQGKLESKYLNSDGTKFTTLPSF